MKILVVGAGGVGGFYGGLLARGGCDVTFLARGEHFRVLQASGLSVKSVIGDFEIRPVQVISALSEISFPDLVLLSVKTYDTEEIGKSLASIVGRDTTIISLQNGIDNDQILQRYLTQSIIIPGIAYIVSQRTFPGIIEQTAGPRNIIFGSRDGQHQEILSKVEQVMRDVGIEATNSYKIEEELWLKFIWIIAFAGMTALCRSPIGPIATDPGTMSIYRRCLDEAFAVARKLGVNVSDEEYETLVRRVENYRNSGSNSKSSMLVDIENHRPTEIESLHGKLCRLAKEAGVEAPVNEVIYQTIRFTNAGANCLAAK